MKATIEKEPQNVVKINIEIPAQDAVDAYNKACKKLAQYVNIPGFRKGKAPRNIVEQNIGEDRIKHEALESELPKIMSQVIEENNLNVATQPYVESYDFKIGEDLKITAKVELMPEITLGDYKSLTLEVGGLKQPEDAVDTQLETLRKQAAKLELVVDRNSNKDDVIVFDFEGFVDGNKIEHGDAKNYSMDLANSGFIPGFADQLVDRPLNEEFEINVTFPENYHQKELAGKPAVFKCKINEIKTRILPELNDEFAQKAGPFKTLDELKADIQKYLDNQKANADRAASEKALMDKIIETTKLDVQDSMIQREADTLLEEYKQRLAFQGFTWEQALQSHGYDEIMKELKEDALYRIKSSMIINKIAELENVKVEPADFTAKLSSMAQVYNMDPKTMLKEMGSNPQMLNQISQQVLTEKVVEFLLANNTIKFV